MHLQPHGWAAGSERLGLVKRLGADLADMVDPHQGTCKTLFFKRQYLGHHRLTRHHPGSVHRTRQSSQCMICSHEKTIRVFHEAPE